MDGVLHGRALDPDSESGSDRSKRIAVFGLLRLRQEYQSATSANKFLDRGDFRSGIRWRSLSRRRLPFIA